MGRIVQALRSLGQDWGRRAAWPTLIAFLVLQGAFGSIFTTPRLALFDLYERTMPRYRDSDPVKIVAIDDASLAKYGQWPWPRQISAQLIRAILDQHPLALGIDMFWSEPDQQSPEEWLKQAGNIPPAISDALRQLPSHDSLLRDALVAGPVVIGLGVDDKAAKDTGLVAPIREFGGAAENWKSLPDFSGAIRSVPILDHAAPGHGLLAVTPDPDGVYRRLPMISTISGRIVPGFSLEILRLAIQAPRIDVYLGDHTVKGVAVGDLKIPTQEDGSIWVNFSPPDDRRFVRALDVLNGTIPADTFDQRLVLIGVTGLGQGRDMRMTPLRLLMHGIEIHAQLLENIIAGNLARRPRWAPLAEPAITLLFGLILIVALPLVRPRWQTVLVLSSLTVTAALGLELWHLKLMLVDVATPMIGQGLIVAAFIGGSFAEADMQRRRLRRELEERKITAAKAEGELEAGRRIQMGILPSAASVAGDPRFDLAALIVPARQIGGDLYDFFKIDADRLFLEVGDVSGKGVPAALFMAQGKSLCKSAALRGDIDIGEIVNRANAEISRDNSEMLFITMFAGILNLATGELHFCNAGHDAPILLRAGEAPQSIDGEGGPPLCVIEDFPYITETRQLQPGDMLCITTDGITEAMTASGALMGRARTEAVLAAMPDDASAAAITDGLQAAVAEFVAGAEPSDDLTILTVRWNGPAGS
jgi:serine phosphatase RsbU (regulator of sigma subunit)/CHASE2 domain-containing sensor protein